jgi:hypothetical protein
MLALLAALLLGAPDLAAGEGKLAIVQGTLEAKGAGDADYKALKVGDPIDAGMALRSAAGTRALIDFAGGGELRVDENTEMTVVDARKLDLQKGRIYLSVVAGAKRFEVDTPHVAFSTQAAAVFDITFVPRVPNGPPAATTMRVLDSNVNAVGKKFKAVVWAGLWITAVGTQLNTPDPLGNGSLDTAWVHPLLAERGRADAEIGNRMMELVGVLSNQTPNDPVEASMRALGDLATPELARYLARPLHPAQAERRAAAARIIGETGTMKSAPALVALLQHAEPEIRVTAARGLTRLNGGKDLGFGDAVWKGESHDAGQKAWETWLKQNSK